MPKRRSPGTPLRRIHSVDHQSLSRITLETDSSVDLFDDLAMEVLENTDSGSSSPPSAEGSPVFPRKSHSAAGLSHTLPRSYSPRPERAMATVLDQSRESSEASSLLSPDGPFPKVLVAPRRSYSVGRRGSGSILQRTPSPFSQLEEIKEGVSSAGGKVHGSPCRSDKTSTRKDGLSNSLLSLPQCRLSPDYQSCVNTIGQWENHSVVMRVSSATGQLEEVFTHYQTLPKIGRSSPLVPGTKIVNLSEEPQLFRQRRRESSASTVSSSGSIKRHSIVLDSVETDV